MNFENDLNLTVNEPPIKKFKKQFEKLSDIKLEISSQLPPVTISELSPASLKVQLQADATMISTEILNYVKGILDIVSINHFSLCSCSLLFDLSCLLFCFHRKAQRNQLWISGEGLFKPPILH
jgi:hypothetical protein